MTPKQKELIEFLKAQNASVIIKSGVTREFAMYHDKDGNRIQGPDIKPVTIRAARGKYLKLDRREVNLPMGANPNRRQDAFVLIPSD